MNNESKKKLITRASISIIVVTVLLLFVTPMLSAGGQLDRSIKSMQSEWGGGLERVITVYSVDGTIIEQYEGKFDVEVRENGWLVFIDEMNDKVMISPASIVVVEEE